MQALVNVASSLFALGNYQGVEVYLQNVVAPRRRVAIEVHQTAL